MDEARAFAREAVAEMVQDGVAEIAHWRGWEIASVNRSTAQGDGAMIAASLALAPTRPPRSAIIGRAAVRALYTELALSPKPGLVSPLDSGAHDDMDMTT